MRLRAALPLVIAAGLTMAAGPAVAGQTALEEVFPDGLPFPFERVLERLRAEAGPDAVQTALIPLGRSLQRYSAAPDFFGSPRIVVAIAADRTGGPDVARLADRLYLGYVPAAAVVEAIAYDEDAGRFEFRQIVGYGLDPSARIEPADRPTCLRCHQGEGPIFARPLWSESNANPALADRLAGLGSEYHGAPVRQSVDALDAFDASTDRAARIAVANRIWAEACPDAGCRAELFLAALRFGLNGFRAGWSAGAVEAAAFRERVATLWPDGLSVIPPDLPNRDPGPLLATADPGLLLQTEGDLDPETPRAPVVLWSPGTDTFGAAAREIASMLSPGDFGWIDTLLRARSASARPVSLACTTDAAALGSVLETRFACGHDASRVEGFLRPDGAGRIDRLTVDGAEAPARIAMRVEGDGGAFILQPVGAAPRLPDGVWVGGLALSGSGLHLELVDDLAPVAAALRARASEGSAAFGPGPFRRRALLRLLADVARGENG